MQTFEHKVKHNPLKEAHLTEGPWKLSFIASWEIYLWRKGCIMGGTTMLWVDPVLHAPRRQVKTKEEAAALWLTLNTS